MQNSEKLMKTFIIALDSGMVHKAMPSKIGNYIVDDVRVVLHSSPENKIFGNVNHSNYDVLLTDDAGHAILPHRVVSCVLPDMRRLRELMSAAFSGNDLLTKHFKFSELGDFDRLDTCVTRADKCWRIIEVSFNDRTCYSFIPNTLASNFKEWSDKTCSIEDIARIASSTYVLIDNENKTRRKWSRSLCVAEIFPAMLDTSCSFMVDPSGDFDPDSLCLNESVLSAVSPMQQSVIAAMHDKMATFLPPLTTVNFWINTRGDIYLNNITRTPDSKIDNEYLKNTQHAYLMSIVKNTIA